MKPLITALSLLIWCACFCQKNNDSLYFAKLGKQELIQNYKNNPVNNLPFKAIRIVDARPDTSNVGFMRLYDLAAPVKLLFPKGLSSEILKFANNTYHLNKDTLLNDLLIIIKEYRISDYAKVSYQKLINVKYWRRGIVVSAELFMQKENKYHALYKVDSIVALDSTTLLSKLIPQSFCMLFNNISNKNLVDLHIGKKEFSYEDIQQHIQSFLNYSILNNPDLKKGVYKNFKEFKSNNPSILNYETQSGKLSDEIYISENNQTYPLHDFWGFCDGKNIFVKSTDNLFPLIKTGKTYNVRGAKSLSLGNNDITNSMLQGAATGALNKPATVNPYNNQKFKIKYTALQLNMQTGELY